MYFGAIAFATGFSLLTASSGRLFWTFILWIVLDAKADMEEALIKSEDEFSKKYIEYTAKIPSKMIPFVGQSFSKLPGAKTGPVPLNEDADTFIVGADPSRDIAE